MKYVPYTCPTIDKVINELTLHRDKHKELYIISDHRMESIIELMEDLRRMHMDLRYNANFYKGLYETLRNFPADFNPEVLPDK